MSKFVKVLTLDEATRVDVASSTLSYIGKALPGTATNSALWKISKLTSDVSGNLVSIEFAAGGAYSQIWDNRAGLSYS